MKHLFYAGAFASALAVAAATVTAADSPALVTIEHHVNEKASAAPSMGGKPAVIYVREKRAKNIATTAFANKVVLFVHGAGTPAEVSFDVPASDYSWMGYLARAGFDVFAVDMTGYGRSTRPPQMNDPCNAGEEAQKPFIGNVLKAPCAPNFTQPTTTLASDWDDVGAAVDYVLKLRGVSKLDLIGWSQGGPRSAGWAAQHQDKVNKMVLLAPAYSRGGGAARGAAPQGANAAAADGRAAAAPAARGAGAAAGGRAGAGGGARSAFSVQSHDDLIALWNRQAPCPGQYTQEALDSVWKEMLASDPVGAKWGTGVRRAPAGGGGGGATWTVDMAKSTTIPTLMVSGEHDGQVNPQNVRNLFEDLGAQQKVFIDLACSSHNAMWEKNHLLLFKASLDWLTETSVNGTSNGMIKLGY
jgi:pimeloyl-ACP methyl ester carboxylesterase